MDSSTSTCYLCDNSFVIDELQKFQPGFVMEWRSNLDLDQSPDKASEYDPVTFTNDEPVIRPPQERHRSKRFGDGHECEYDIFAADGRCVHCLEEHNFCCLLNRSRCDICHRVTEDCPKDESKAYFLSRRLLELEQLCSVPHNSANELLFQDTTRPLKVIVFSQFRAALNFIGDRLLRKFGTACVAEYYGSHRKQELQKFTSEPSCFCLLLTKDGSEGLDLSFVTNIIFLEEIFDKSLADQAIARAWRMGAKGKVTVETLIAKNSIEEVIGNRVQSSDEQDDASGSSSSDQQRLKSLLLSLRFNTDHHLFSSSVPSPTDVKANIADADEDRKTLKWHERKTLKRQLAPPDAVESTKNPKRQRQSVQFVL
jgi:SNF2 family DNA or RNA helicase